MRAKLTAVSALLLFTPFYTVFADAVGSVNQLVVFGDSLSDNGNASLALLGSFPGTNYATRSIPGTGLSPNIFTDGANTSPATAGPFGLWIDQFAGRMGLPQAQPALAGGTDFAVGGADTGSNGLYFVSDQVGAYLLSRGTSGANPTALYTFWAGANDIADAKSGAAAADNVFGNIQTLAASGAKNFLWLNLPNLGDVPKVSGNPAAAAFASAQSAAFDSEWAIDLTRLQNAGIHVIGVDVETLFGGLIANPSAYGLTNVTTPAQGVSGINPNDYLFWDDQHPTTAADALVAQAAFAEFTAAPEPASLALAAFGFLALLVAAVLTHRNRAGSVSGLD
jgi:phospholipase/lecithinase/hemolysin